MFEAGYVTIHVTVIRNARGIGPREPYQMRHSRKIGGISWPMEFSRITDRSVADDLYGAGQQYITLRDVGMMIAYALVD